MMLVVLLVLDLLALSWMVYCQFLQPGAVYFPSKPESVQKAIKLAKVREGETVIDLGSGDGRVLIEFAQRGVYGIGYEINPWLVWVSRRKIDRAGLSKFVKIKWKSMWQADFSKAQIVYLYQFPEFMNRLYKKMIFTRVKIRLITNDYAITEVEAKKVSGKMNLYLIGA